MNRSLLKIELGKLRLYLVVMSIVVGYVLFNPKPLRSFDVIACLLGLVHGSLVGFLVFKDFGGVESFMFSRSFTRNKLFWHRWSLGIALQFMTMAVVTVMIASGLRSLIFFRSAYQPMIKWYELNVLWAIAFGMFAGFAVSVFFTLRNRILNAEKPYTPGKRIARYLSNATGPLIIGIFFVFGTHSSSYDSPGSMLLYAWLYVIAINAVTMAAGRQCFLKMEINN